MPNAVTKDGSSISLMCGGRLPLQQVLMLGLRPILFCTTPCSHAGLGVLVHGRAERGRLGDELAGAGAVEAPAVVDALEAALAVDAALGQRREAVRAGTRRRRGRTRRRRRARGPSCPAARRRRGRTRGRTGTTGPASRTRRPTRPRPAASRAPSRRRPGAKTVAQVPIRLLELNGAAPGSPGAMGTDGSARRRPRPFLSVIFLTGGDETAAAGTAEGKVW
jgi:hypothetical protein